MMQAKTGSEKCEKTEVRGPKLDYDVIKWEEKGV